MRNTPRSCSKLVALLIIPCCYLVGCASSVVVQSDFPTPLVEPLPVRVGLIFGEELRDFQHHEDSDAFDISQYQISQNNEFLDLSQTAVRFNIDHLYKLPGTSRSLVFFPYYINVEFDAEGKATRATSGPK